MQMGSLLYTLKLIMEFHMGSVLGPILLTLYILPFGNIIYFYSFADHTQLYFSMKPDHNHQLVALKLKT